MNRRIALARLVAGLATFAGLNLKGRSAGKPERLFPAKLPFKKWAQFPAAGFSKPACGMIYGLKKPPILGMPLGGIDTGYFELRTDATLGYCTAFNSICPQRGPLNAPFLGMKVGEQVWLLSHPRDVYIYMFAGVQAPNEIRYWGHYPVADLEYDSPGCPLRMGLRIWTPFLPGDSATSNTPGVVFEVHLRNLRNTPQQGKLMFSFPGPTQAEAQITNHSPRKRIPVPNVPWVAEAPQEVRAEREVVRGQFAGLVVTSEKVKEIGYALGVIGEQAVEVGGGIEVLDPSNFFQSGPRWLESGTKLPVLMEKDFSGSVSVAYEVKPGEEKVVRFVLAWYAPMWIGEGDHTFTHMYTTRYKSALEIAQLLSREHESLLRRVLGWQEVIYTGSSLPVWLRESLVNILHLFPINSLWAAARPPIGPWCRPEDGLFGLLDGIVEDPAIEPIPDTFYANPPLVFFFPDLALSTLRGYKAYQFANGAAPFVFGGVVGEAKGGYENTAGTEFAMPTPGYQTTTNGPCFVDMVDRYLRRTGNRQVLREFYEPVKRNTTYTMSLRPEDGADGIISVPSGNVDPEATEREPGFLLEMVEVIKWFGMTPHVGGMHLAQLRMAQRMAEEVGDNEFAQQCRQWLEQGSASLESKLWAGDHYLAYYEPKTGKKSDLVFGYQLGGQWMAKFHGLPGVFRSDRVKTTLATIRRTCAALAPYGATNMAHPDGTLAEGVGYGPYAYFPPELYMLAMTYMYEGERPFGLDLARRCLDAITVVSDSEWDQPNIVKGDDGERLFGTHYGQNMMLWALPAAVEGKDISAFCAPGGFADRILHAARNRGGKAGEYNSRGDSS